MLAVLKNKCLAIAKFNSVAVTYHTDTFFLLMVQDFSRYRS